MTPPSQLADLIARTARHETIDERPERISFRGPLVDDTLRKTWLALRQAPATYIEAISIDAAGSDEPLADDRKPGVDELFQIRVDKRAIDDTLQVFFGASLSLHDIAEAFAQKSHVLVGDMPANATFTTYRSRVEAWTSDAPLPFAASEPLRDPRTFTSDFTQRNLVPSDIRPWLSRVPPAIDSPAYAAWRQLATRRLLASLADHVSLTDEEPAYGFTGPPACTVILDEKTLTDYFTRTQEGAGWVFAQGDRDADTRHLLLANEWARTFRKQGLEDLGEGSLESAKGAYNAYVKSGSKETLRALAELRKSVVDESQKISQRAQDLIGAIWKDIAVASAPFVLKVLPDTAKVSNSIMAGGLAVGAGLFLVFSFAMQVFINRRWFVQSEQARALWKSELNLVLSDQQIASFSDLPITTSIRDYRWARFWVGVLYAVLICALAVFAWFNFTTTSAPTAGGSAVTPTTGAAITLTPMPTPKLSASPAAILSRQGHSVKRAASASAAAVVHTPR